MKDNIKGLPLSKDTYTFTKLDLVLGGMYVRINRLFKKLFRLPDIDRVTDFLYIGGEPIVLDDDYKVINLRGFIEENNIPSLSTAVLISNEIERAIKERKKVLIHCRLGRSRAPMMAVFFLRDQGFNLNVCVRIVREVRKGVYLNKKQLEFLRRFE